MVLELVRINSQAHEPKALVIQSICTKDKLFLDDKDQVHSPISTVTALERHSWVWVAPNSHYLKAII